MQIQPARLSQVAIRIVRFVVGLALALSGGAVVREGGYTRGLSPNADWRVIAYGVVLIAGGGCLGLYPFRKFRHSEAK